MERNIVRYFGLAALAAMLAAGGCAKKTVTSEDTLSSEAPAVSQVQNVQPAPAIKVDEQKLYGGTESLESAPWQATSKYPVMEGRTSGPMVPVYFDFDKSNVRADQKDRIVGNAQFLRNNSSLSIRIEGNCDDRGTNEYNMALGERRSQSAKSYLVNLGIDGQRIRSISYGEERPLNYGHDELAWSQNRRADFVVIE